MISSTNKHWVLPLTRQLVRNAPHDQRPMAINYANSQAHWYFFPNTHKREFGKKSPFETPALITHDCSLEEDTSNSTVDKSVLPTCLNMLRRI